MPLIELNSASVKKVNSQTNGSIAFRKNRLSLISPKTLFFPTAMAGARLSPPAVRSCASETVPPPRVCLALHVCAMSHLQSMERASMGKQTPFSSKNIPTIYFSPPSLLHPEHSGNLPCGLPASSPALLQSFAYAAAASTRSYHSLARTFQWLPIIFRKTPELFPLSDKALLELFVPSSSATLHLLLCSGPWLAFSSKAPSSFLTLDNHPRPSLLPGKLVSVPF